MKEVSNLKIGPLFESRWESIGASESKMTQRMERRKEEWYGGKEEWKVFHLENKRE